MELKYLLESLFFVSTKSLDLKELATFLKKDISEVEMALKELTVEYQENNRGLRIIESGRKYQMASTPDNAKLVQDFLQTEISGELTPASLETLTIIAYRGPISKFDLERIRGVNCSLIIRNLMLRGLVEEKFEKTRNENLYAVSLEFIKFLGLSRLEDLPDYESLRNNQALNEFLAVEEENR